MTLGIIGISNTGISNISMQNLLVSELNSNQTQINQLQTEISSGYQFQLPSQNPQAAMQVEGIQSLLERKTQMQTNISSSQSSLSQTDSTLSSAANLLTSVQSAALSVVGTTATASQRQSVIEQIDSSIQQLVSLGNAQYNGQNLFGGTDTTTPPFSIDAAGNVAYSGNSTPTKTYVDVGQLFDSSITGAQAFGAMSQPIEGSALTPALSPSAPLADLNGGQGVAAGSIAISDGTNTSIVNLSGAQTLGDVATLIEQNPPAGRTLNVTVTSTGLTLQLQPGAPGDNLTVQEINGGSTAADLGILNVQGAGAGPLVGQTLTANIAPTTALSSITVNGAPLDTSGLQITSEGKTYTIKISGGETVQDLLNSINDSGAGLDAEINSAGNGINVSSRVSGADFSIGENGGLTATQLGIRTFTAATQLSQLNLGAGVGVNTAMPGGTDFTISDTLGSPSGQTVQVPVSIAGDTTVGDVLNSINAAAQAAGATFKAQLATSGNGIELIDSSGGPIVVTANSQSTAAVDLGLVPAGKTTATSTASTVASGVEDSGPNSELLFQAVNPGSTGNVQVVFQANAGVTAGNETVQYNAAANTLTFQIASSPPPTTANDIIAALANNLAASAAFTASLDTAVDPGNDGSGAVGPQSIQMSGGADVLTGSDSNPQQTDSVFNALSRLGKALSNNNQPAIQQAMTLLSNSMQSLGDARDQLGVQEQSLTSLNTQITNEQTNLQSAMSTDYDTNMTSAVSDFTAAQIAYQATLQTSADALKLTLLNYL